MTSTSVSVAAVAAASLSVASRFTGQGRRDRSGPRNFFFCILSAVSASMRLSCARRWTAPLAPPMPMADGTGRRPTTLARRRPFCSFASSDRPCARVPLHLPRCCRCWRRSPAFFPPIRAARKRAKRFSSSSTPIMLGLAASTAAAITPDRHRAGALGRYGSARHPGRAVGRIARSQRARRNPRWTSFASVSRHPRYPLRRRSHRRSSRQQASRQASC